MMAFSYRLTSGGGGRDVGTYFDACALDAVLDGGDAEPPREEGAQAARRTGGPGHTRVRGHQPYSLPDPLQIGRVGIITVPTESTVSSWP